VVGSLPPGVAAEPGDLPVDRVTLEEAEAFCRKLRGLDGRGYRLPTEAEWEFACRAGMMGTFGDARAESLGDVAWYRGNSGGALHAVGTRRTNRWGLADMLGNAAELTADRYVPHLGNAERVDPAFSTGDAMHVVRGGTVADAAEDCRAASRGTLLDGRGRAGVGFRVAADLAPTGASVGERKQ
jgi:formylglycine-generating enzyme required for sulfatase activity